MSLPELKLQDREINAYRFLYNYADKDRDGRISSGEAVNFLKETGLKENVLGQIWQLANPGSANFLSPNVFFIMLRLVSLVQAGHSPNVNVATTQKEFPLPRVNGIEIKSHKFFAWNPAPYETLYSGIFDRVEKSHTDYLSGSEAISFFGASGLPNDELRLVWQLSDEDGDAMLTRPEFCVAMYLIHGRLAGEAIPGELPEPMRNFLHGRKDPWIVSPIEKENYKNLFQQGASGNLIDGNNARQVLMQSGLPNPSLGKIWEMCDRGKRGAMDRVEFSAALHIIQQVKSGTPIPNELPLHMIQSLQ